MPRVRPPRLVSFSVAQSRCHDIVGILMRQGGRRDTEHLARIQSVSRALNAAVVRSPCLPSDACIRFNARTHMANERCIRSRAHSHDHNVDAPARDDAKQCTYLYLLQGTHKLSFEFSQFTLAMLFSAISCSSCAGEAVCRLAVDGGGGGGGGGSHGLGRLHGAPHSQCQYLIDLADANVYARRALRLEAQHNGVRTYSSC
eukprot:6183442-Pleurochrysis_carterae.AAC.3